MIKVDTTGIAAFRRQLALEMARIDREISAAYYQWSATIFRELVEGSAQWSGNLTSNWNYSVGGADYSYTEVANKRGNDKRINHQDGTYRFAVFEAGANPAVADALSRMKSVPQPTWRDKVYMTNMTPSDSGNLLEDDIVSGRVKLRPVNLVQGQAVTIDSLALKYGGTV